MIVKTNVFPKLKTVKDVVRQMSKEPRFRTPFDSQQVKGSQTLVKSAWQCFYGNYSSHWENLTGKMSSLVICEILVVFVPTLTVDDQYPLRNSENLSLPIQMQLYKNRKTFSQFLVRNFHQSLNILKKKMLVMTNVFVKLKTAKDVVGQMSKEPCFRTLFDIQYVKGSQRLVKSA